MPVENSKYDVAISFLSKDAAIAAAIHQKLSEGLKVFFYPRNQEQLAGTDGMESMRKPFLDDSRIVVVLYRELWGKTPWTRVEETAIKDGCLQHGWQRLFFVVLDSGDTLPVWLPQTHVRFNYSDFGLEQAVGAIKARVQENGGQYAPLTPAKRAEIFKAEELFRRDKARMNSAEGIEKILDSLAELFRHIERQCADINAQGFLQIRCGTSFKERSQVQSCTMTDRHVSMVAAWNQLYTNVLDHSSFTVSEYNGGLILPSEMGQRMYIDQPQRIEQAKYSPDLSLAREYGWVQESTTQFVSSSTLAERCVIQFLDLINRYANGEIKHRSFI